MFPVFRKQEKERMAAPNKFYTYHIGNFSAVVPPIRGAGGKFDIFYYQGSFQIDKVRIIDSFYL